MRTISKLLMGLMTLFLISCGSSSEQVVYTQDTKTVIDYPSSGEGTFQSPYNIGNGVYQFKGEKYYSINVTQDDCNVLLYGIVNFDSTSSDITFIDDSHSNEVIQTYDYLYENLDRDGYDIVVNSTNYATFGIFSTCISSVNAEEDAYITLNAGDRITIDENSVLYKFRMQRVGSFLVNTTGSDLQVRLYNSDMEAVYSEYDNQHEKVLQIGDYFMLVSKTSKEDVNFVFDISTL